MKPPPELDESLEKYLNALCRRLWSMPLWKRIEIRREVASHLDLLIAQARCEGRSAQEATRFALRQFGRPELIGRYFARQWHKENRMKIPRIFGVLGLVVVVLSSAWLVMMASSMSRILFPANRMLISGKEGAQMHIKNGILHVTSGEAGFSVFNPTATLLAWTIPFVLLVVFALIGCISLLSKRQSRPTTA